jgi:hypothetical protein
LRTCSQTRTHTPPDTHVYVSVATDGTDAVIEVRDEAPAWRPKMRHACSSGSGESTRRVHA